MANPFVGGVTDSFVGLVGTDSTEKHEMASNCARKSFQIASSSAKTLFSRRSSNANKFNASSFQASPHKRSFSYSSFPVQLAGAQVSLTPLHSVTASALFTSLLSLHNNTWGCLSEGFATPL